MAPKNVLNVRAIVGLEIHVQLATRTKLFCGCAVKPDAAPNTCVCGVCLGFPGTLPVLNRRAFELAVLAGMALKCEIARHTKWDRKSYYYPDLPKNYQISQYDLPVASAGIFDFDVNGISRQVRIRRAHLEEDAGKNLHDAAGFTLVDLNRAGTPLLEIVTEPDITSADEAYVFCTELHRLVTHLGVSDANMQKGQMRFEPNVNVALEFEGKEFRTPIAEIKNINSFKFARQAIEYEVARQVSTWENDHDYLIGKAPNENRGWDAERGISEFQRGKEGAHDYRYFPDPDLAPIEIPDGTLNELRAKVTEAPVSRRRRFIISFGLSEKDAETIIVHRETAELFEAVVAAGGPAETTGKQFVNVWLKLANDRGVEVTSLGVDAKCMAELAKVTANGTINKSAVAAIAEAMLERKDSPELLASEMGLVQVQDTAATEAWVDEAIAANQQAVSDALSNPKKMQAAVGFLRGQVMKISGGKADPKLVGSIIETKLGTLRP